MVLHFAAGLIKNAPSFESPLHGSSSLFLPFYFAYIPGPTSLSYTSVSGYAFTLLAPSVFSCSHVKQSSNGIWGYNRFSEQKQKEKFPRRNVKKRFFVFFFFKKASIGCKKMSSKSRMNCDDPDLVTCIMVEYVDSQRCQRDTYGKVQRTSDEV